MKSFKYFLTFGFFVILIMCCSCIWTAEEAYVIGQEYNVKTFNLKVEGDEAEERFILYYTVTAEEYDNKFAFDFHMYQIGETLKNSSEFEYSTSDPDEKVVFNENGYYCFYGSRTFYISYRNASEEVKDSIANKEFDITFPFGTFVCLK